MFQVLPRVLALCGFALGVTTIPHRLFAGESAAFYRGDLANQEGMAEAVDHWVADGVVARTFSTGSARFDSEWIFGTYQMAALGFGQLALEHPEVAPAMRARMERAIDRLLEPRTRTFDTEAWGSDALAALGTSEGHAAFLGYTNLVLGLHRTLYAESKYRRMNDELTRALSRRLEQSPVLLAETYPEETFPVDNTAVVASIAVHARATHAPNPALVARWSKLARQRFVHPESGLLYQLVRADGTPVDAPRGSGTALGAYFLSFADPDFSLELHQAVERELASDLLGFRVVREYPRSVRGGNGDIDSGPLVLGFSVSATGFALAGCRIHRDPGCYSDILATADLFGAPVERRGVGRTYVSGGPLGDAILFAMQTAQPRQP